LVSQSLRTQPTWSLWLLESVLQMPSAGPNATDLSEPS
jgi:hypothetical protein